MKRVIAEDEPALQAFDENAWIARLDSQHMPIDEAVNLFAVNRQWMTRILRQCSESDFARTGQHTQAGRKTLADLVTGPRVISTITCGFSTVSAVAWVRLSRRSTRLRQKRENIENHQEGNAIGTFVRRHALGPTADLRACGELEAECACPLPPQVVEVAPLAPESQTARLKLEKRARGQAGHPCQPTRPGRQ